MTTKTLVISRLMLPWGISSVSFSFHSHFNLVSSIIVLVPNSVEVETAQMIVITIAIPANLIAFSFSMGAYQRKRRKMSDVTSN